MYVYRYTVTPRRQQQHCTQQSISKLYLITNNICHMINSTSIPDSSRAHTIFISSLSLFWILKVQFFTRLPQRISAHTHTLARSLQPFRSLSNQTIIMKSFYFERMWTVSVCLPNYICVVGSAHTQHLLHACGMPLHYTVNLIIYTRSLFTSLFGRIREINFS